MRGSSGILGTLSRYTDSATSVSLGTAQVSYSSLTPLDPGSPIGESDVTDYTMTTSNMISLSGGSSQNPRGLLTITVQ